MQEVGCGEVSGWKFRREEIRTGRDGLRIDSDIDSRSGKLQRGRGRGKVCPGLSDTG